MRPNAVSFAAGNYQQYWSIMTPGPTPTFQNFTLTLPTLPGTAFKSQDLFCAGHSWNKRGELLVVGGDRYQTDGALRASSLAYTFAPNTTPVGNSMWKRESDLSTPRWYPTVTTMATDSGNPANPKDLVMITGGLDATTGLAIKTYEAFAPLLAAGAGAWEANPATPLPYPLFPRIFAGPTVASQWQYSIYPRNVLLSSGKIFTAGMGDKSYRVLHDAVTLLAPPFGKSWA